MTARGLRAALLAALALAALAPAPAAADFHFVSIREVFPGDSANPDAEYVELQAWASGQNVIQNHTITFYNAAGGQTDSESFDVQAPNGQNQVTFVMASLAANSRFAMTPDDTMPAGDRLSPAGGAVCWEVYDCVSWGSFSGGSLPSPAGSPAVPGGIPDGQALRRTIAPGCPTLLEASDDRDNSAVDFTPVFPAPRPNAVPPTERACDPASGGGGGGGGGQGGTGAPQTRLRGKPSKRTTDRTPTFRFRSDTPGARFQCKLDRGRYRSCRSPFTPKRLGLGRHVFRVRAKDGRQVDPSPAVFRFTVIARRR
jgi:hypothetical protein